MSWYRFETANEIGMHKKHNLESENFCVVLGLNLKAGGFPHIHPKITFLALTNIK